MSGGSIILPELEAGRRRSSLVGAPAVAGDDYPSAIDLKFSVDIVNTAPRQAAGSLGLKSFTVYDVQVRVLGTDRVWTVQRRYNEFLRLYRALQDGMLNYSSFPPKKFFGNMDPAFIRQRSAGLAKFLQTVLDLPHIATKHPEIDIFFGFRAHLHGLRTALSLEMASPAQGVPSSPPGALKRRPPGGERRGSGSMGVSPGGLQGLGTSPLGRGTPTRLFTPPPYVADTNRTQDQGVATQPTADRSGPAEIRMGKRKEETGIPRVTVETEKTEEKPETKTPVREDGEPPRHDLSNCVEAETKPQENLAASQTITEKTEKEVEVEAQAEALKTPPIPVLPESMPQETTEPLPSTSISTETQQTPHEQPPEIEPTTPATHPQPQGETEPDTLPQLPPPPQHIQPLPTHTPDSPPPPQISTPPTQENTQTHAIPDAHPPSETIEDAEGTPSLPLEGEDTFVVLPALPETPLSPVDTHCDEENNVFEAMPAEQSCEEEGSDAEGEQSSLMEVEGAVVDESCSNYAMAQLSNQRELYVEGMHSEGPSLSLCVDDHDDNDEDDDGFRAFNQDDVEPKYGVGMVELEYDPQEREERLVVAASKRRVQFPDVIDFWDAIKDGDLQGIERYLACRPHHVDLRNALGFTPLMSAALLGHFELVAYFVDQEADLNATNFEFCTALHYAVIEDDVMIARYLIEHGADLTVRDFEGKSPIELTEDEDLLDAMEKVLREKGLLELDQGDDSEFGEDEEEGAHHDYGPQSL